MIRTFTPIIFGVISMTSMGQHLTLKGVPVTELTATYIEVYDLENSTKMRDFEIVIDAGQLKDYTSILERKGGTDGVLLRSDNGEKEPFNGPIEVINYLHEFGGYNCIDISVSVGSLGRYKHYLLEKQKA